MQLQDYINMDIDFLKKILKAHYGEHYTQCSLAEILTLSELYKDDIRNYILYPINPLYDYFVKIGITDESEMRKVLATLFYFSIKDSRRQE